MPSNTIEQRRIFQIDPQVEAPFKVFIVARDSLSSGLFAEALKHGLGCDAFPIKSSDLLRMLGINKSALVIISAELDSSSGSGFDLARRVSCAHPDAPIVMLLDNADRDGVVNAFHSGARGVFNRQEPVSEFLDCVEHVRRGMIWAGSDVSDVFLETFRRMPAPGVLTEAVSTTLTKRELQVVQCAARGKTNKTIASDLSLSEHTVKNYLFRAFEKLGVSSRVELLFYLTVKGHSFGPSKAGHGAPAGGELE